VEDVSYIIVIDIGVEAVPKSAVVINVGEGSTILLG
jgi:hypothetical protein